MDFRLPSATQPLRGSPRRQETEGSEAGGMTGGCVEMQINGHSIGRIMALVWRQ